MTNVNANRDGHSRLQRNDWGICNGRRKHANARERKGESYDCLRGRSKARKIEYEYIRHGASRGSGVVPCRTAEWKKASQRAVRKRRKEGKNVLKTVRCESGDMWSRARARLATLVSRKKETKKKPQRPGRDAQDVPPRPPKPKGEKKTRRGQGWLPCLRLVRNLHAMPVRAAPIRPEEREPSVWSA